MKISKYGGITLKKKIIAVLIAVLLITLCSCTPRNELRIGTAGLGGIYNEFGTALSQLAKDKNDLQIEVRTTAGSAANVRLLSESYLELAVSQADIINDAYYGENSFEKSFKGYSAVAGLYAEACHIVVRADSDIKTVDDLFGKKICVGEEESGSEANAMQILSVFGLNENNITKKNLDYAGAAKALAEKKIDAFFCTVGTKNTVIEELSDKCDISVLSLDNFSISKLISNFKFFTEYTIPANTYKNQKADIKTVGVNSVLLASNKLSEEKVEQITSMIFENADSLQYTVSADLELDEQKAVNGITIPFHKGAAKYYSSKNITVATE